jgi:hypothetical protein
MHVRSIDCRWVIQHVNGCVAFIKCTSWLCNMLLTSPSRMYYKSILSFDWCFWTLYLMLTCTLPLKFPTPKIRWIMNKTCILTQIVLNYTTIYLLQLWVLELFFFISMAPSIALATNSRSCSRTSPDAPFTRPSQSHTPKLHAHFNT